MQNVIRFDWAIKRVLRNKANFEVLEGLLTELLLDEIKIQEILDAESNQDSEGDKFNRVDLLVSNSKAELIIIQIQNDYEIDYFHRIVYGHAKAISENLDLGQIYQNIKRVISVEIVYFDLGRGEDYVYEQKTEFIGRHKGDKLELSTRQKSVFNKSDINEIFPKAYVIKVNKFPDIINTKLDEWIYFLKYSEIKESFTGKGLKKAKEILDIIKVPKEEQYAYNRYLDSLHHKASMAFSMKDEAEQKLILMGKIEMMVELYAQGMDIPTIAKIAKMSQEEVKDALNTPTNP